MLRSVTAIDEQKRAAGAAALALDDAGARAAQHLRTVDRLTEAASRSVGAALAESGAHASEAALEQLDSWADLSRIESEGLHQYRRDRWDLAQALESLADLREAGGEAAPAGHRAEGRPADQPHRGARRPGRDGARRSPTTRGSHRRRMSGAPRHGPSAAAARGRLGVRARRARRRDGHRRRWHGPASGSLPVCPSRAGRPARRAGRGAGCGSAGRSRPSRRGSHPGARRCDRAARQRAGPGPAPPPAPGATRRRRSRARRRPSPGRRGPTPRCVRWSAPSSHVTSGQTPAMLARRISTTRSGDPPSDATDCSRPVAQGRRCSRVERA